MIYLVRSNYPWYWENVWSVPECEGSFLFANPKCKVSVAKSNRSRQMLERKNSSVVQQLS